MKKQSTLCLALSCVALTFGALLPEVAHGQGSRDQYSVVEAYRLNQHPQRYWSRGVVFEDTFIGETGRRRQIDGRRVIEIETRALETVYVDARLEDRVERMTRGQYVFSGTVLSESRRFLRWSRTTYRVVVDSIERLDEGQPDDLLDLFAGDEVGANLEPILQILAETQRRLIVEARNEGVPVESMFDAQMPRGDRAIEIARASVRRVEREAGLPAAEILSLLVREVMVAQQGMLATHATEPIPVPEIELDEPDVQPLPETEIEVVPEPDPVLELEIDPEPVPEIEPAPVPLEETQEEEAPLPDETSADDEVQPEVLEDLPLASEAWGDEIEADTETDVQVEPVDAGAITIEPMDITPRQIDEEPVGRDESEATGEGFDQLIIEPDATFGLQPSEAPLRLREAVPLRPRE